MCGLEPSGRDFDFFLADGSDVGAVVTGDAGPEVELGLAFYERVD